MTQNTTLSDGSVLDKGKSPDDGDLLALVEVQAVESELSEHNHDVGPMYDKRIAAR
jgi:hypothetical protein